MKRRITIAGGGLAGLSLGIALRERGVPVSLCDAGRYPRHRVCGEFISGVRQDTLQVLGIADVVNGARQLASTKWFVGDENVLDESLPEAAIGVSRFSLDEQLAARFVSKGGDLRLQERVASSKEEGLVWAVGRQADRESGWLGLKVHACGMDTTADLEMHLGEAGYVGTARVEEGRVNVCGLFRKQEGVTGRGAGLLKAYVARNGMTALSERLAAGALDEESFVGVSAIRLGRQVDDGLFRLGDAESIIPPFTGNGMSMALEAAETALDPLCRYAEGELSWGEGVTTVRELLQERFAKRLTLAKLLHPLFFADWGRKLMSSSARCGVLPFQFLFQSLR